MKTVKLPNWRNQVTKTEAKRRIRQKYVDGDGVERWRYRWVREYVGQGDDRRVVKWRELFNRIEQYIKNNSLEECRAMYEHLTGDVYGGINSKKGVAVAYIKFLFDMDLSGLATVSEILRQLRDELAPLKGEWGLGCPYNCGRFHAFKVEDGGFLFKDRAAWTGPQALILEEWDIIYPETGVATHYFMIRHWEDDERVVTEVPINRGYLNLNADLETKTFVCDRCGGEVRLEP